MFISRFDFLVPDFTMLRAQQLKSVTPENRPADCVRITASVYYTPETRPLLQSFQFDEVDEPKHGFPMLCHFLGYWRDKLNDAARLEFVIIPSGRDGLSLALRYPTGHGGTYKLI